MKSFSTINDRKIKAAIVGCGRISKNHFGSIEKHQDNIELVAICDIDKTVLSDHKNTYKVKAYLDIGEMLNNTQIDLVILCLSLVYSSGDKPANLKSRVKLRYSWDARL